MVDREVDLAWHLVIARKHLEAICAALTLTLWLSALASFVGVCRRLRSVPWKEVWSVES